MGTSDLPDMYICPKPEGAARGLRAYISGKSRVPMLQVLCNTSGEADSLNANTRVISEFFIYACLNNSIMVKCG